MPILRKKYGVHINLLYKNLDYMVKELDVFHSYLMMKRLQKQPYHNLK